MFLKRWLRTIFILIMSLSISVGHGNEPLELQMEQPFPQYLFKILSLEHWQASENQESLCLSSDDDEFIHFSQEDQLDRIIDKYWNQAATFVVLKIDTQKLHGKMVLEANPGGSNQYYHLYNASIPMNAVVEQKYYPREELQATMKQPLKIVSIGDLILRQTARRLSEEEILSGEMQEFIQSMKTMLRNNPAVGLAAPQVGRSLQIAVIEDRAEYHLRLTPEQLQERERVPVPLHVIINPILHFEGKDQSEFFEGCVSVPDMRGVVARARRVCVECLDEQARPVVIHATGWYARILQHEIDHLNGVLFLDRAKKQTLTTEENFNRFWNNASTDELKRIFREQ
jgi:peptide deformylase